MRQRDGRVVGVIFQRIGDRLRHGNEAGNVNDGVDVELSNYPTDQSHVAGIALDKLRLFAEQPTYTRHQTVEHDDSVAAFDPAIRHLAADLASTARNQYRHH